MKKLYIKFCGGCNPVFNRSNAVNEIIDELEKEGIKPEISYDDPAPESLCLLVEGCSSACLKASENINCIIINSDYDIKSIIDKIKGDSYYGRTSGTLEFKTDR